MSALTARAFNHDQTTPSPAPKRRVGKGPSVMLGTVINSGLILSQAFVWGSVAVIGQTQTQPSSILQSNIPIGVFLMAIASTAVAVWGAAKYEQGKSDRAKTNQRNTDQLRLDFEHFKVEITQRLDHLAAAIERACDPNDHSSRFPKKH